MKPKLQLLVVIVALVLSTLLYMPVSVQELVFKRALWSPLESEVIRFYNKVFNISEVDVAKRTWFNLQAWSTIRSGGCVYVLPQLDYKFTAWGEIPAPPLTTLTWLAMTYVALALSGSYASPLFVATLYAIQSAITLVCVIMFYSRTVFKRRDYVYPPLLVSVLFMAPYSIEVFSLMLVAQAIVEIENNKFSRAVAYIGLASGFNYFLTTLFILLLFKFLARDRVYVSPLAVLSAVIPYLVVTLINPYYYSWIVSALLTPQNSLGLGNLLSELLGVQVGYKVIAGVWLTLLFVLTSLMPQESSVHGEYIVYTALLLSVLDSGGYPYTLLPLLAASTALGSTPTNIYLLVEFTNALTHILYVKVDSLASLLALVGIRIPLNVFSLENPIQWVAQLRNSIVLALVTSNLLEVLRRAHTTKIST